MKDKLYRQLDNLWRGDTRKAQVVKRILLGYVAAMERDEPSGYSFPTKGNVSVLKLRRYQYTPTILREATATQDHMFHSFRKEDIRAQYRIAVPAGQYQPVGLDIPLRYAGTYDKNGISLVPGYRETTATMVVSPTWHRMVKEVGAPFTKSRNKIVKLVQRVSNRRTYDGGYTVWDVDYFDIKDRNNPVRIEGVGVRNGDCLALDETFPKAYAACKALVVKEALRELKDSIKDETDVD